MPSGSQDYYPQYDAPAFSSPLPSDPRQRTPQPSPGPNPYSQQGGPPFSSGSYPGVQHAPSDPYPREPPRPLPTRHSQPPVLPPNPYRHSPSYSQPGSPYHSAPPPPPPPRADQPLFSGRPHYPPDDTASLGEIYGSIGVDARQSRPAATGPAYPYGANANASLGEMFGAVEESAYNRNSFASNRDIISMYAAPYGGKISPSSSDYSNATARPPSSPSPPTLPAGASPAYHPHGQSFSSSLVRSQAQVVPQATRPRYPPSLSASPLPAISHSSQSSHSSSSYGISPLNYPTMNGQTHPPPTPYGRLPNSLPPGIAPSDAFYSSDPRRGDPRQTSRNAVRDPAAGDWRNTLEASRIYEGEPASQSSASSPASSISSRQPTIVTTPPIESSSRRPPSLSMSSSPSVATHSTFSQPPPSSPATSYHRRGNLSSNNSLTPNSALRRADSAGTTSDLGGANGLPEFLNPALLSNIAVFVKDRVPRGPRQKGAIEHPQSFTGDELVTTIQLALPSNAGVDRPYALQIARSLQQSLWYHEVDWDPGAIKDAPGKVYVFPQDEGVDSTADVEDMDEIPTGVLTSLTPCLSPYCGQLNALGSSTQCYSYSCPNKAENQLQRRPSLVSTHSTAESAEEAENWATSVPKSIVESLSKSEIQRQSLIFELIQGEQSYLNDLDLVEKGFVQPLRTVQPPIVAPEHLDAFLSEILLNLSDIREHSRTLLAALLARQRETPYVVKNIGDVVLSAALDWGPAYTSFTIQFPLADSVYKEEKARNPRFKDFLMDFQKRPESTKRGFDTFQSRPTFRGLRYTLILEQILKNTPEGDPDRDYLQQAIAVIKQQSLDANEGIATTKSKVACRDYARDLQQKPTDTMDLDLLNDQRRHFMSGKVYRKTDGSGFTEWAEGHLILFDHYLVVTKPARQDRGHNRFPIARRAVPLDLIQLKPSSFSGPAVPRNSGFHIRSARFGSERHSNDAAIGPPSSSQDASPLVYPIFFNQIGRYSGPVTYYVDTPAVRQEWEKKFKEAIALGQRTQEKNRVVRLEVLSDQTFGATTAIGSLTPEAPASTQFGRPTCSVPLTTTDGQSTVSLIVAGCAEGLFIGFRGKPRSMKQVVHLAGITQCAVLQEFGFILVVASKVLIAYSLEALVPSGKKSEPTSKVPQRLSGQKDVLFFRVGKVGDIDPRTLVIYVKQSGVKESVFKALEPVASADRNRGGGGHRLFNFGQNKPDWFRTYKDFFIPSMVFSVQFLRSKLAIICARGVEVMDLESLRTMSVPDFSSHQRDPVVSHLARQCEESKTLGMFRLQDNLFLLVYDEMAFHVNKYGSFVSTGFEWETKPEQVAFHFPYIYAFSPTIIEIRHAFTGHLAQVITGSHIALTFDGAAIVDSGVVDIRNSSRQQEEDIDRRIHVSKREGAFHVLYELVPLYAG